MFVAGLLAWPGFVHAQDCGGGNIILTTQNDVDDFFTDYGPCNRVSLALFIGPSVGATAITNLDGLSGLVHVEGLLISGNSSLTDISGLSTMTSAGGINITDNALSSLNGLQGLTSLVGLTLQDNPVLTDLTALAGLTTVQNLAIGGNGMLVNIDELTGLTKVTGNLIVVNNAVLNNFSVLADVTGFGFVDIRQNPQLASLDGLQGARALGGLIIEDNDMLGDLDPLANLVSVGNTNVEMRIAENDNLTTLRGLSNLVSIDSELVILNNFALTNLDGLGSLVGVNADVDIRGNSVLEDCSALGTLLDENDDAEAGPGPGVAGVPDVNGDVTFFFNAAGCDSTEEIFDGPALDPFSLTPGGAVLLGDFVDVQGVASDIGRGDSNVINVEYALDAGPWMATTPLDGNFDSPSEAFGALLDTGLLSPEVHQVCSRAEDALGHIGQRCVSIAVVTDFNPPMLAVTREPSIVTSGGQLDIAVTATDPSGIKQINIIPFDNLLIEPHMCAYPSGRTEAICELSIPWHANQTVFKFRARAENWGSKTAESAMFIVLFDQGGPDSDGDGLSDEAEDHIACVSPSDPDTDGDTLPDGWEVVGLEFPDGDFVDLPQLGAQPCARDVFVQLDWEPNADFSPEELQSFVNRFRGMGMYLHIEQNERSVPAKEIRSLESAAALDADGEYYFHPKRNWTHRYVYSSDTQGRSGAWGRYVTIDHDVNDTPYRFMHELGHTLGLGHGGKTGTGTQLQTDGLIHYDYEWDSTNYKPQHLSIQNYGYGKGELCYDMVNDRFVGDLTYTRTDMPEIDESVLDERSSSDIAMALQSRDQCAGNPDLVSAMVYSCQDLDNNYPDGTPWAYYVVTDSIAPLRRRRGGDSWQTSGLPVHNPGIDFNCDGIVSNNPIDTVSANIRQRIPGEACDDTDTDGDGDTDEGCDESWAERLAYASNAEWPTLPTGHSCNILWKSSDMTYPQPEAYRTAIDGVDCQFQARGAAYPRQWEGENDLESARSHDTDPHEHDEEPFSLADLPDLEFCDGVDNDSDGAIDESCLDSDADGTVDAIDNCPATPNPDQTDLDINQLGDDCQFPEVSSLSAVKSATVMLNWAVSTPDVIGFNIYRMAPGETEPRLLTSDYPTTTDVSFEDAQPPVPTGDFQYWVTPINLKGVEGPPAMVSSDETGILLLDGFE